MRNFAQSLIAAVLALGLGAAARAGEVESKVAGAAFTEFTKEQIKYELATLLNRNPNLVGSTNPQIGSITMKWLSRCIAAYNLILAKTDRDRSWAATYLVLSPEPVTAAILLGAQLIDTLMTLRAQRDVLRIYLEAEEIQARAATLYSATAHANIARLQFTVQQWGDAHEKVKAALNQLNQDPVTAWIESKDEKRRQITEDQIADLLALLMELRLNLTFLEGATLMLDSNSMFNEMREANRAYDLHRSQLSSLQSSILKIFANVRGRALFTEIQKETDPYLRNLQAFHYCADLERTQVQILISNQMNPRSIGGDFLTKCRARFHQTGDNL